MVIVIWRKAASHPSWRQIHSFGAGDNATTAQPADELICRREGWQVGRHVLFPQNCHFPWGIWTPSNRWFLGPTWVLNPNGISIGPAVLQFSLVWQTNRQTDRQTTLLGLYLTIGRIYVRNTATRHNNNKERARISRSRGQVLRRVAVFKGYAYWWAAAATAGTVKSATTSS